MLEEYYKKEDLEKWLMKHCAVSAIKECLPFCMLGKEKYKLPTIDIDAVLDGLKTKCWEQCATNWSAKCDCGADARNSALEAVRSAIKKYV